MNTLKHLLAFLPIPLVIFIVSPIFGGPVFAKTGDLEGFWATEAYSSVVEIKSCATDGSRICGTIVWLWDATDGNGRPVLDEKNPDVDRKTEPLLRREILIDMEVGPLASLSAKGEIYNPEDGRTYRATIKLVNSDTLHVDGCVLFLCQTQVWRRPSSLPHFDLTTLSGRL